MPEVLCFKFDCEWLCNFVRQRVYWEGMPFTDGVAVLKDTFGLDNDIAFAILMGTKKIVGINEGELVDDDKQQDYMDYVARNKKETTFSNIRRLSKKRQYKEKRREPSWTIKEDNTYDFCESREVGMYLAHAKLVPCEPGVFTTYGLISPDGDFYACDFAGHESCAVVLAYQKQYFSPEIIKKLADAGEDNPILYFLCSRDNDHIEFRGKAKDMLYDRGWIYVNTMAGRVGLFYSKWGEIENMPQKAMDTAYDYIVAKQEEKVLDIR